MTHSKLEHRLEACGFTVAMYRRAQAFFEQRKMLLHFDGRGPYRNMFYVSGMMGGGRWSCYRAYSPEDILDRPGTVVIAMRSDNPAMLQCS